MTLLFCHGIHQGETLLGRVFDELGGWNNSGTSFITSRHGTGSKDALELTPIDSGGGSSGVRVVLPSTKTTLFAGVAVRMTESRKYQGLLKFLDGSNNTLFEISVETDNSFRIQTPTETIATDGSVWSTSTWIALSLQVVVDSTAGEVRLWTGDTLLLEQTGLDTGSTAISKVSTVGQQIDFDNSSRRIAYEDFWVDDAVVHANARIASLRPDADGFHQDWVRSDDTVSAYTLVNDQPTGDDTTYLSSDTDGDRASFDVDALPSDADRPNVGGVMAWASAEKTDSENRTIALSTRLSSTDYDGTVEDVSNADGVYEMWENNPDTAAEWQKSEVDAAEYGVLGGITA